MRDHGDNLYIPLAAPGGILTLFSSAGVLLARLNLQVFRTAVRVFNREKDRKKIQIRTACVACVCYNMNKRKRQRVAKNF